MASFYAELQVAGHTYPVRHCAYEFTQATNERGRVAAKVRHSLVQLMLDVPDDHFLVDWASTPFKPLPGRIVFFDTKGRAARETLSWEAGNCVGYQEQFTSGNLNDGAYVCFVAITAPKLTMQPGGPGRYVPPAPREHGRPEQALINNPFILTPPATPTIGPPSVPPSPLLARIWAGVLRVLTSAPAMTAALVLMPTNSRDDPGYASEWDFSRRMRDQARLAYLENEREHRALSEAEEADLIALLAKVRGIRIESLADLDVQAPLRGGMLSLPGFRTIPLSYTKRTDAAREALRRKFDSVGRKNFLKHLGGDPLKQDELKKAGLTDAQIRDMAKGLRPSGYQVHHKLPLDDGGDNSFDNLLLIKNDPYHLAITNAQNAATSGMKPGDTRIIQWPMFDGVVYPQVRK